MNTAVDTICTFFEQLSPQDVQRMHTLYAPDAYFKDPFNEVRDVASIEHIFAEMYVSLHEPRFLVHSKVEQGNQAFLTWDFNFRIKKYKPHVVQTIRGSSHLKFDEQGRVCYHRDYWDAAEELYEKLPIVGGLMRFLKKRLG